MLPKEAIENVENFKKIEHEKYLKEIQRLTEEEYEATLNLIKDYSLEGKRECSNMIYYSMGLGKKDLMSFPKRNIIEYVVWGVDSKLRKLGYDVHFNENNHLQMFSIIVKW